MNKGIAFSPLKIYKQPGARNLKNKYRINQYECRYQDYFVLINKREMIQEYIDHQNGNGIDISIIVQSYDYGR